MDKRINWLLTAVLSAPFPISAATFNCHPVNGQIPHVVLETSGCTFLSLPGIGERYPDLKFFAQYGVGGTCFTGTFSGTAGTKRVSGTFYSALSVNSFSPTLPVLTAATALRLTSAKEWTGTLYFQDVIVLADPTQEKLVFVSGEKPFETEKTKSSLFIDGNILELAAALAMGSAALPEVTVSGQMCRLK